MTPSACSETALGLGPRYPSPCSEMPLGMVRKTHFNLVFHHTSTIRISNTHIKLRHSIALLSCFTIPL